MEYRRMPIEIESPEQLGYNNIYKAAPIRLMARNWRDIAIHIISHVIRITL